MAKGTGEGTGDQEVPDEQAVQSEEDAASAFRVVLDALSRMIPPALIDKAAWGRVRATVRGLPVDARAGFGFELPLGEPTAGTDLYVTLRRGSVLANHHVRLGERASPGSAEARLGSRLAALDTDAPWCDLLTLEYDVMSGSPGARPGLFARFRSGSAQTAAGRCPTAETAAEWLAGAVGWELAGEERQALERVFGVMTAAGAPVNCIGIMPDRPGRTFKVIGRPVDSVRAMQVLDGLGLAGPTSEVAAFLSRFEGLYRTLRVALDVTAGGVSPRVGLEISPGEAASFSYPRFSGWSPLLARLCEEGLCRPEKRDGLLAWPGRDFVFRGSDAFGVMTGIGHAKVSFDASEAWVAVDAKAYPSTAYLPFEMALRRLASR